MPDETTKYWTEGQTPPVDLAIARLAERQHGAVALGQLRDLGMSASAVRSRVATGRLHCLHRGVYAVGRREVSVKGLWTAAVLACGDGAVLSHRSALALRGVVKASRRWPDVTAPKQRKVRRGIRVHESKTLLPRDLTAVENIPCTSVARTLVDFADEANDRELRRAVDELEKRRLFDGREVDAALRRANGRRGTGRLQAILSVWTQPPFTRSEAERRVLELIAQAGLPRPLVNTWVEGHEVDLYWPEHRLVVEIDGFEHHSTRRAFEQDRLRDADLDDAGLRVRRVTWRQIEDGEALVERLRRALG